MGQDFNPSAENPTPDSSGQGNVVSLAKFREARALKVAEFRQDARDILRDTLRTAHHLADENGRIPIQILESEPIRDDMKAMLFFCVGSVYDFRIRGFHGFSLSIEEDKAVLSNLVNIGGDFFDSPAREEFSIPRKDPNFALRVREQILVRSAEILTPG